MLSEGPDTPLAPVLTRDDDAAEEQPFLQSDGQKDPADIFLNGRYRFFDNRVADNYDLWVLGLTSDQARAWIESPSDERHSPLLLVQNWPARVGG